MSFTSFLPRLLSLLLIFQLAFAPIASGFPSPSHPVSYHNASAAGSFSQYGSVSFPGDLFQSNLLQALGNGQFQLSVSDLLNKAIHSVFNAGLSSAFYGTDFGEGALANLTASLANTIAGQGIGLGGDIFDHDKFTVQKLITKALINCAAAEIKGASCASGAIGSLVTELVVEAGVPLGGKDIDAYRDRLAVVAAVVGYFASGGKAENVDAAVEAALLDFDNNCGLGYCVLAIAAATAALWTAYDVIKTYREEGGEAALKQLALDGAITIVTGGAGKIAYKIGGKVFKSGPKAWKYVKESGLWKATPKVDPNKLNHIFGKSQHNLDDLVKHFGSQEKAYNAIQNATQTAVNNQGIKGVFETTVKVGGETITIRGNVIDGVAKIGTAFK